MPPDPPAPTLRLDIDTGALADNWQTLDALSGNAAAGAAVKADCYGLGVDTCVPVLRKAGCRHFFVAHWSEVAPLTHHVPAAQIAVLHGPVTSAEADYARALGVVPVINSPEQANVWSAAGGGRCHLMVDTGINRLGVAPRDLGDPAIRALEIDVLMSHLACADEDGDMNLRQLEAFRAVTGQVAHRSASLANSAGIALGPDYVFDVTRPGLALYGGIPRGELAQAIRPVARIRAALIQCRTIEAGESVGYNAQFTASAPMRIGTVSLGYADGFLRVRGQGAAFCSEGRRLPVLGKVSMDMVVVDLSEARDLGAGDWIDVPFDIHDAAQQTSLSQYELLTTLGTRFKS
ncbi:MAG: alanine racemase [Erythrobacter sp.]|uniref:alanine racemase n=1 Tax=Erythrobacter sp. TaxID=1042 RepID=UPI0032EFD371